MNVGVIGCGVQGERHARIYSNMKCVNNLYIFDTNESLKNTVSNKYSACPTSDVGSCLENCDAVSICVPTEYHYGIACDACDAGVNFLVEKPVTDNYHDAVELCKLAPGCLTTGVGHIERFNPIVQEIQKILISPEYVEINRHNPSSSRITTTSVTKDLMIHDIDILTHVLFKDSEFDIHPFGGNDVCGVNFSILSDGCEDVPIYISASRLSSKKFDEYILKTRSILSRGII
jgi:predicted dehydrogenase